LRLNLILRALGLLSLILAGAMVFPLLWALVYREGDLLAFIISIGVTGTAGLGMLYFSRSENRTELKLTSKEGMAIVTLSWVLAAVFGALPYLIYGTFDNFPDALFETMSGFTTTGATVLEDIEAQPHGILFWRSLTHWLGGMGIILLFVAVLPQLGIGAMQLFKAEVPGPAPEKFLPRVAQTAKVLWLIYVGISVLETILLYAAGLSLFDAMTHTFATMATGGFSTRGLSIGAFNSVPMEVIIILFMVVAGGNFGLYYSALTGNLRRLFGDAEFRFYLSVLGIGILTTTVSLAYKIYPGDILTSLRHAAFQVVSITTTTGFTTDNFDAWTPFGRGLLFMLMFLGGCGGSTAGAMKQVRLLVLLKYAYRELYKIIHPRAVIPIRIGKKVIPEEVVMNILGFILLYLLIFVVMSLVMTALGLPLLSAFAAVAATLGNIGPGLEMVGPLNTYAPIPALGKVLLTLGMLAGRLEVYPLLFFMLPEVRGTRAVKRKNSSWTAAN